MDADFIRQTIREAVAEVGIDAGYLDPLHAAQYLGISPRTFAEISRQIPHHKLTVRGKRLFRKEDLDAFMAQRRHAPATDSQLTKIVDDVVAQVRSAK